MLAYPDEVGRFFTQLPHPKCLIKDGKGLGVVSSDQDLIEEIRQKWCGEPIEQTNHELYDF